MTIEEIKSQIILLIDEIYQQGYDDGKENSNSGIENNKIPTEKPSPPQGPPKGNQPPPPQEPPMLYKVGLISDPHFDCEDSHNSEYKQDLINAIKYFKDNNVSFIASCGDYCNNNPKDYVEFYNTYNENAWKDDKLKLFTAIGNHDHYLLKGVGGMNGDKTVTRHPVNDWNELLGSYGVYISSTEEQIEYCKSNSLPIGFDEFKGDDGLTFFDSTSEEGKLSYYFWKNGDIYVFLSVDYGIDPNLTWGMASMATNKLDYNNSDVKEVEEYISDTDYTRQRNDLFNYQFYNSKALLWLKDILEKNKDKRVFVFSHHFLPQKSGNGTIYTSSDNSYYSYDRIYPYNKNYRASTIKANSNTLCGMQFYFLNKLNNLYKNSIWFSGHSHFSWKDEDKYMCFCDKDFNIYRPDGTEKLTNYGVTENCGKMVYTRKSDDAISTCGLNVHLPSLSRPIRRNGNCVLYGASEGAIMEVYANRIVIKPIEFKSTSDNDYTNKELGTVTKYNSSEEAIVDIDTTIDDNTTTNTEDVTFSYSTNDGPSDGFRIIMYNKTSVNIEFSNKFNMYTLPTNQTSWHTEAEALPLHFGKYDNASGGYSHWYSNPHKLAPNEKYKCEYHDSVIDYCGTGVDGVVNENQISIDKYVGQYFVQTDNDVYDWNEGGNAAGGIPGIKLGYYSESANSNASGLLYVQPLADGYNKIEKGKTYHLVITKAHTNSKYWNN